MQTLKFAEITVTGGVANDFRGKPGRRQVTVVSCESWSAVCAELNATIHWTTRRAR